MLRRIALIGLLWATALPGQRARISGVDSLGMTVSDLDRSIAFYTRVLTFEEVGEYEGAGSDYEHLDNLFGVHFRRARLRLGDEFIELTEYLSPAGLPAPADARSNDRWFQHIAIIVSDMNRAYGELRAHKVRHISPGPQRLPDWNKNAGGIQAFYFRDPDGHPLEILAFPPDKGDPKWHGRTGALFLGIDHTAIGIADTERSLRFYRDGLGLRVSGESENYGVEQERLNNVFGARLHITALRGETGPGIELLEYLTPSDGRPFPEGERASDLIHWQTRLRTDSADAAADGLRKTQAKFVSTGVVALPRAAQPARRSVIVRDPDGHAIEVTEQQTHN